ncbi:hypothetical protein BDW22DRAFT_1336257 [Trametopsis cervina]|nr:hypothetical protein BDW22DRAFT_1336257 [Trametopsis cervina]
MASSASRSLKGYVAQREWRRPAYTPRESCATPPPDENRPSLRQWAGQTLRAIAPSTGGVGVPIEKLALFPGWAHRKYRDQPLDSRDGQQSFDVELYVSGFASQASSAGFGTRSGRTFLYAAKLFAALPKIVAEDAMNTVTGQRPNDPAVDELIASMRLPPKPEDMNDDAEARALAEQMHDLGLDTSSLSTNESSAQSDTSSVRSSSNSELQRLHKNLESRFLPFVSSSLAARPIKISIYAADPEEIDFKSPPLGAAPHDEDYASQRRPILTREVVTSPDGSFQTKILVPWEMICTHPAALHIAFGDPDIEHTIYIAADLMTATPRPAASGTQLPYAVRTPRIPRNMPPVTTTFLQVPVTNTTIRLISDIDDTVKTAGILSGSKAAFYNVFVKDLAEGVIPGMGDWYTGMWKRGVRFHYVSNSPFELLPVINEFLTLSRLPPGSIKLRSYTGRRLLSELFKASAERKRAGIIDVLDHFPDGRFFLVGDSGEQDLELYATLASDRPQQVLGVFIRDASTWDSVKPLDDPTGEQVLKMSLTDGANLARRASLAVGGGTPSHNGSMPDIRLKRTGSGRDVSNGTYMTRKPKRLQSINCPPSAVPSLSEGVESDYFTSSSPVSISPLSESPTASQLPSAWANVRQDSTASSYSTPSTTGRPGAFRQMSNGSIRVQQMTEAEKKQYELQTRVYKARSIMPKSIPLRVFRDPAECVETAEILEGLNMNVNGY